MTSPLVDVAELHDRLGQVSVLDVRYRLGGPSGREEFEAGHLPGAAYVDLDTDLAGVPGVRGRHPMPDPEMFGAAMRRAGVSRDVPVVVYDDWGGRAAARAWWLLRHHGHTDVRVLDGGLSAWRAAAGRFVTGTSDVAPGDFDAAPEPDGMPWVGADQVMDVPVLLDARAPERFRGEVEPVDPVAGHVPGALNVPTETNLDAEGRFRSPERLVARYAAAGVPLDVLSAESPSASQVAAYCGSGVTAAHHVLALASVGVQAALYPGSWSEWIVDPSRPVVTGD